MDTDLDTEFSGFSEGDLPELDAGTARGRDLEVSELSSAIVGEAFQGRTVRSV